MRQNGVLLYMFFFICNFCICIKQCLYIYYFDFVLGLEGADFEVFISLVSRL